MHESLMWDKKYKDHPPDTPLKKYSVEPSRGIIGCEMHDINGWGNYIHIPIKKARTGVLSALVRWLFPNSDETQK